MRFMDALSADQSLVDGEPQSLEAFLLAVERSAPPVTAHSRGACGDDRIRAPGVFDPHSRQALSIGGVFYGRVVFARSTPPFGC